MSSVPAVTSMSLAAGSQSPSSRVRRGLGFQSLRTGRFAVSCPTGRHFCRRGLKTCIPWEQILSKRYMGVCSDCTEIVMGLEEEYGISAEKESAQTITTVQEAADLIEKLLETK